MDRTHVSQKTLHVALFTTLAGAALLGTADALARRLVPLRESAAQEQSYLDRHLTTTEHLIYGPPGELRAPTDASAMGFLSRVARVAVVPFGFESDSATPRTSSATAIEPHVVAAPTVRAALDAFVRLDPRYEWRDASGLYVVRTRTAWNDSGGILNRRIPDVDWRDVSLVSAYEGVARILFPQERGSIFSGIRVRDDRPFSVQVSGGTLLDLLNAIALADGQLAWWVRYGGPSDRVQFELTIGHFGVGLTHGWRKRPGVVLGGGPD
jgi:hypothetical protein